MSDEVELLADNLARRGIERDVASVRRQADVGGAGINRPRTGQVAGDEVNRNRPVAGRNRTGTHNEVAGLLNGDCFTVPSHVDRQLGNVGHNRRRLLRADRGEIGSYFSGYHNTTTCCINGHVARTGPDVSRPSQAAIFHCQRDIAIICDDIAGVNHKIVHLGNRQGLGAGGNVGNQTGDAGVHA